MSKKRSEIRAKVTSAKIHNQNCFKYIKALKLDPAVLGVLPLKISEKLISIQKQTDYQETQNYSQVYSDLIQYAEENLITIYSQIHAENKSKLDSFIVSIYENDNGALSATYDQIKGLTSAQHPSASSLEKRISRGIRDSGLFIDTTSPSFSGSLIGRGKAFFTKNFMVQRGTNVPTIRRYNWQEHVQGQPMELRFGTQGQRKDGQARVSPLFEQYLKIKQLKIKGEQPTPITHIYFNNLGKDRTNAEGRKEKALTEVLEALESTDKHPNVAVITLPADKGLMDKNIYKKTEEAETLEEVRAKFIAIAKNPQARTKVASSKEIRDFHISENIRKMIFKDPETNSYSEEGEVKILDELIDQSLRELGIAPKIGPINDNIRLSPAQSQALWFHFTKYTLTNHIIEQLKPQGINFSCKDAIDRGGASSAYYNLIKSFGTDKPMSRAEFDQALHAAPTMVKGRGMNHHVIMVWNAVDAYISSAKNYTAIRDNPDKSWLIEWRDLNCPHARVDELSKRRIPQIYAEIRDSGNPQLAENSKKIMDNIAQQLSIELNPGAGEKLGLSSSTDDNKKNAAYSASGKRMLLEAAVRTRTMAIDSKPSELTINRYEKLADELITIAPELKILGGTMKILAGKVLAIFSKEKGNKLQEAGHSSVRAAEEAANRNVLSTSIEKQISLKERLMKFEKRNLSNPSPNKEEELDDKKIPPHL